MGVSKRLGSFRGLRVCYGTTTERQRDVGWILAKYGDARPEEISNGVE